MEAYSGARFGLSDLPQKSGIMAMAGETYRCDRINAHSHLTYRLVLVLWRLSSLSVYLNNANRDAVALLLL